MKILYGIIGITLLFYTIGTQNYEDSFKYKATYILEYKIDSTNVNNVQSENTVLYLGDKYSRFSSKGMAIGDSLMRSVKNSEKSPGNFARLRAQIPESYFNYYIFKNIPTGKISMTEKIVKDNWRYTEEKNLIIWDIKPEKKEINGFTAQKATGSFRGRDYIAWFTEEIPIPEGPYKFSGLPGLIIKITDSKSHYNFELIEFKKLNKPIKFSFDPDDYIETDRKDFLIVQENYEKNPIGALEKTGMKFNLSSAERNKLQREHLEDLKSKNNPLELQ